MQQGRAARRRGGSRTRQRRPHVRRAVLLALLALPAIGLLYSSRAGATPPRALPAAIHQAVSQSQRLLPTLPRLAARPPVSGPWAANRRSDSGYGAATDAVIVPREPRTGLPVSLPTLSAMALVCVGLAVLVATRRSRHEAADLREALDASEARYHSLVEHTPLGVVTLDRAGRLLTLNRRVLEITGAPDPEPLLAAVNALHGPVLESAGVTEYTRRCLEQGETGTVEVRWTSAWGRTVDIRMHYAPHRDSAGTIVGAHAVMEDITERTKTEEALRASEERYRQLATSSRDVLWTMDLDGCLTYISPAAEQLFGLTTTQMVGLSFRDGLLTPDGRRRVEEVFYRALTGAEESALFEAEFLTAKRGTVWCEIHVTLVRDEEGQPYALHGVTRDISARKQVEAALRDSEAFLKKSQEIAQIGSWAWDLRTNVVTWSDEVYRIYGMPLQEHAPPVTDVIARIHPEDVAAVNAAVDRACWSGAPYTVQHRIRRPSGTVRWVHAQGEITFDEQGTPVRMMGTTQDITDRRRAEAHHELLATAVEQAAEAVVIADIEGQIQYVNPAFERCTGYARQEVLGKHALLLTSGAHTDDAHAQLWDTITGGKVWTGSFLNRRKDGSEFEEEAVISPVRDSDGRLRYFVKVARDVSVERRLEAQLRQSHKLEAVGTLAGGIAHDFNNILTGVLGFADLARVELPQDSIVGVYIEEVIRASERARELVKRILTFSRAQEGERIPIDLRLLVSEVLALVRAGVPTTVELRSQLPEHSATVSGDATQLHQVILNLCTNAAHAMPDGGRLDVVLERTEVHPDDGTAHPDLEPGAYVRLTVRDTGAGMDAETVQRIFEPYFTTRTVGDGSGLGLAVVHGIVLTHGGQVEVQSTPGQGSTFTVYLPASPAAPKPVPAADPPPVLRGHETILLVEDESVVRAVIARALETLGYTVLVCGDGVEALANLRTHAGEIALVLTDKTMPRMTGLELARHVREEWPELPVILCTGTADLATVEAAEAAGVIDILHKPIVRAGLGEAVRRALDGVPTPA